MPWGAEKGRPRTSSTCPDPASKQNKCSEIMSFSRYRLGKGNPRISLYTSSKEEKLFRYNAMLGRHAHQTHTAPHACIDKPADLSPHAS